MPNRGWFLAAAAAATATIRPAGAQTVAALRIGANPNDPYAEPYYGDGSGIFARAGIPVTITTFPNGGPIVDAVASGALDVGISNPPQMAAAIQHGIPFVFFAGAALYDASMPTSAMCVASDSAIREAKDLVGKTIAVSSLNDGTYLASYAYLHQNGIDPSSVKFVEIPFGAMGAAVQRGTTDAAVMVEPALTIATSTGGIRVFSRPFDAIATRFLTSGWFTTVDWYAKNIELARRFRRAVYATASWANANHEASARILLSQTKLDPVVVRKMVRCVYAETLEPAMLDPILAVVARLKLTDHLIRGSEMIAKG